jgi:trehalose 6-phosphate synthase
LNDIKIMKARLDAERDASAEDRTWTPARLRDLVRDQLEGARIIVLANREPIIHNRAPDGSIVAVRPASGLVSALEPVVRACAGTWVAHGSGTADRDVVDRNDRLIVPPDESPYTLRRVWLSEQEEQGYYYGFANEGLWPLCHIAHARPTFRTEDFEEYRAVNERFVDTVVEDVEPDDPVILVQDYHFALAPKMLRERLPRATIVLFWHIPWPNAEAFGICPWRTEILEGMLGASIVGFHTQQHSNNFIEAVDGYLEARIDRERSAVVRNEQETLVRQYPISVEWPFRWAEDIPDAAACRDLLERRYALAPDALIGIGVDRLDYTKGIEERFRAVERLLERYPEYRGRFTFIQLAAPSRAIIPRYRDFTTSVVELANSINHRLGRPGYRPILLRLEHHEHAAIVTHYRAADFCYVSSLHDGMNLVAKEFVASREDDQGVLLLSHFTGSARELTEALIVNPYDIDHASDAMARALTMAREEQRERMRAMRQQVREWNVFRWAGRMLIDASHERHRTLLADRLGRARALQPMP